MSIISLTDKAISHISNLVSKHPKNPLGLRVSLRTKGCSGLAWSLSLVYSEDSSDDIMNFDSFNIYIDPKASLFIFGSVMDYKKTDLEEGFTFINPQEKDKCGCGESFTV